MSTLSALRDTAPDQPQGEFDVEYVAEDGIRHRAPLADAAMVRFAAMMPAQRFKAVPS